VNTDIRSNDSPQTSAEASETCVAPDYAIDCLARCLLPELQRYFESKEGQTAFAKWKAKQP